MSKEDMVRKRGFGRKRCILPLLFAFLSLLLALPGVSAARDAYVVNFGDLPSDPGSVSTIDIATGNVVPILDSGSRSAVAITPDGTHAYITNEIGGTVSVIDTTTKIEVPGSPIDVGRKPRGIAITPDGARAYVANHGSGTVSVIDTATNTEVPGSPIDVGFGPIAVAITPDGAQAYVANYYSSAPGTVSVIDTATNAVDTIEVGTVEREPKPRAVAITPDGKSAYVANESSTFVSVIDTATNTVDTFDVGAKQRGVDVSPDGSHVYVTSYRNDSVTVIDTNENEVVGDPIGVGEEPFGIAVTPDGSRGYIANERPNESVGTVSVIDTVTNDGVAGPPIEVGIKPWDIAIVPNQGPVAEFTATPGKAGDLTAFDASGSTDSDGEVVRYDWDFGDGTKLDGAGPTPTHIYASAGTYTTTLTVTDNEGGSTDYVSDGRTAYHNGGEGARKSLTVDVTADGTGPGPGPGPFIAGRPEGCERVLYENRLEVPREARLADLVKGKGVKVRASASQESSGTVEVEITGRQARHFRLFGKKSRVNGKKLASAKVRVGKKPEDVYLVAKGKARRLIKRALRLKKVPKSTKLKVSLNTHAVAKRSLGRLNTQTVRALRRGKVKRAGTYVNVRQVVDMSRCGLPLTAEIRGPRRIYLSTLVTRESRPGRGTTLNVSCSEDCTATVGIRLWGRYEIGLKFRKPGERKNRMLASRKIELQGGETKTLRLKGVSSKRLRKLLVRGARKKRYKRVKLKYFIEARTSDGRSDAGAGTSRVLMRFR